MTNYFPPEPDGNQIYTAESGTIVKVRKEGSNYKIAKLPKPTTGNIALTATPNGSIGYNINYEYSDTTRLRNDTTQPDLSEVLPALNPTLEIYNTDIFSIKVNLENTTNNSFPLTISTNSIYPLSGIAVGSLFNNSATSGEYVKWYPGVDASGTFYYVFSDSPQFTMGGTITVIPAP